jgi:hemolysin D
MPILPRTDTSETPDPFLAFTPPPWAVRSLAAVLIVLFGAALLAAIVVRVPETVSAPFVLVPVGGADPVRAPRAGTVAAIQIREGQSVRLGEPALVLRASSVGAGWAEVEGLERAAAGTAERRALERQRHEGQTRADAAEERRLTSRLAGLGQKAETVRSQRLLKEERHRAQEKGLDAELGIVKAEIEFKGGHLALARDIAARYQKGYEHQFMSWVEYARYRIEAERVGTELVGLQGRLEVAGQRKVQISADHRNEQVESRLAVEALETEAHETRETLDKLRHEAAARAAAYRELDRSLGEEIDRGGIRVAALRRELDGSRGNEQTVTIPCAGTVVRLGVRAPGAVVQEGELLAEVACGDAQMLADLALPNRGVGRLRPGLSAKLFYDAFPYQRHGARPGTVEWVSPASVTTGGSAAFRAHVTPADLAIRVDGQSRPLQAGMTGRAEIVVGRHALITYAFEPLRRLRENRAAPPSPDARALAIRAEARPKAPEPGPAYGRNWPYQVGSALAVAGRRGLAAEHLGQTRVGGGGELVAGHEHPRFARGEKARDGEPGGELAVGPGRQRRAEARA